MRIAQVAPLYESVPPKLYGGTERVVAWLTEELVRRGHDVTLFASGDSVTSARLLPMCPEALRLSPTCIDEIAHHALMMERVFQRANEFDIIHFHTDYLQFPLCRRHKVPHVTTLHGRLDIPDLVPLFEMFSEIPVISISDAQRTPLPWLNWQGTVCHGLPLHEYKLGEGRGNYLAFLGRTSPEKGLDKTIEIAKKAGMPLKIAAKIDRNDVKFFESVIKPMLKHPLIEFIGEIGEMEKEKFLGDATALLFPICWPEPFGLVMIEAMACGTPVIAYAHGSVPEILVSGVTGYLAADVRSAVAAIKVLSGFNRRKCRKVFEERFSASRMANDYLAVYERLVSSENTSLSISNGELHWLKLASSPSSTT
jgi:glycosyltransferase involved in cell wall biosynthesis